MAIDSLAKRASVLYFVGHRKGRLVPDGTIASPDFQNIVGFYLGIQAADILQIVTLLAATVVQPGITPSIVQLAVAASVTQPTITPSVTQPTLTASVTQPTIASITVQNDIT